MVKPRTSRNSPCPSTSDLRSKFSRLLSRHKEMKLAFHHLKSQITIGLLEVEDVFQSLAIPLMTLVGLKTVEMAKEGRFSTIVTNNDMNTQRNESRSEKTQPNSPCATEREDEAHRIRELEEESYTAKATMASKELLQKQRVQLKQLVYLLRKIEKQVNSSQDDILQTLADHQASIHKFFQNAIAYMTAVHQTGQSNGTFVIALKLFKATYDCMDAALGSVGKGVEDMMYQLAEHMCNPMVDYVKGLKAEMATGTCPRLLAIVEDMGGAMRNRKMELEEARKKVRVAEQRNHEALCRLKQSEEKTRKMKEYLGFFLGNKKGSTEHNVREQFLGTEEDQAKDERLQWELLKSKQKYQAPTSPLGPQELLCARPNKTRRKTTRERPPVSSRPVTRSYLRGISPQTRFSIYNLPLGSSPSAASQQVLSRKRMTP